MATTDKDNTTGITDETTTTTTTTRNSSNEEEEQESSKPWLRFHEKIIVILITLFTFQLLYDQVQQQLENMWCNNKNNSKLLEITIPGLVEVDDDSNNNSIISINPCHLYSSTYEEARTKFREAVEKLDNNNIVAELHTLPVHVHSISNDKRYNEEEHVDEDEYTIDIAVINRNNNSGNNNNNLVVHSSGVHGIEGYAGSAIQIGYLQWLLAQSNNNNSDVLKKNNTTLIMIHSINPFGMKNFRRVNENNVDLNRNGIINFKQHMIDVKKMQQQTDDDNDKDSFLYQYVLSPNEQRKPASLYEIYFGIPFLAIKELLTKGYATVKKTLVQGQYIYPNGLFYGGNQLQPSLLLIRDWFLKQESSLLYNDNTNITWLDVHTGLGKRGIDVLLPSKYTGSDPLLMKEVQRCFPQHSSASSQKKSSSVATETDAVNKGYEDAKGFIIDYFTQAVFENNNNSKKKKKNVMGLVQEIGSLTPPVLVAHSLIIENLGYHFYKRYPFRRNLRIACSEYWMKRSFYLYHDISWKYNVLTVGIQLLHQSIIHRNSSSSSSSTQQQQQQKQQQLEKNKEKDHDDADSDGGQEEEEQEGIEVKLDENNEQNEEEIVVVVGGESKNNDEAVTAKESNSDNNDNNIDQEEHEEKQQQQPISTTTTTTTTTNNKKEKDDDITTTTTKIVGTTDEL